MESSNSVKKIIFAMLAIVIVATMIGAALYVRSLPGASDVVVNPQPVIVQEQEETFENVIEAREEKEDRLVNPDEIRSLVLRYKDSEGDMAFRFEFFCGNDSLMFTGWYQRGEEEYRCSDQAVQKSRIVDVTDILEKYIVGTTIKAYRDNPEGFSQVNDERGALEIVFTDGKHANFGYPNGAGNEIAKYCINLTKWLSQSQSN